MEISRPVLVVIDMQIGFLNEHAEPVIAPVARLVSECRQRDIPIVFTAFNNFPDSPFQRFMDWGLVSEPPETDIHPVFRTRQATLIQKGCYTAFTPRFEALVTASGWKTIILCGISTESCVLKTAIDTFERNVRPVVITDACASNLGLQMHEAGLKVIEVVIGKRQLLSINRLLSCLDH